VGESVFIHVTVVPTATFSRSGLKALSPSVAAPVGIVTDDDGAAGAAGDGVGDRGVEGEELPPQAAASSRTVEMITSRDDIIESSEMKRVINAALRAARRLSLQ